MEVAKNVFKPYLKIADEYRGGKGRPKRSNGQHIHKLSSNEHPFGPSPKAIEAIQHHLHLLHEYPDNDAIRLRESLSEYYANCLHPDQFFCAPSGSELIEIIIRGFTNPGDELIITSPTFLPYRVFGEKNGVRVIDVPLVEPDFHLDETKLLSVVSSRTRLIFLASPNNPTGNAFLPHQLTRIARWLPDHVIMVIDEVYADFVSSPDYTRAEYYVNEGLPVIGLNSFSKSHGLAGLRVGYAYSTLEIAAYLRLLCKPFLLSTLCIEAGIAALLDTAFLKRTVDLVHRERSWFMNQLEFLRVRYWPSQGNFVMIETPLTALELERQMLENHVMIRPLGWPGHEYRVRISIGQHQAMEMAIWALAKVLEMSLACR